MMGDRFRLEEKGIYRMCNAGMLLCVCLFGAGRFLGIGTVSGIHIVAAIAVFLLLAGMNFLKGKGRFLYLIIIAVCLGMAAAAAGLRVSLTFLQSYFRWLTGNGNLQEEWLAGYELLQIAVLAVLCYLAQFLMEKYPFIRTVLAVLFLTVLVACLLTQTVLPHPGVVFLFCYIVTGYVEWEERRWKKARSRNIKAYMLWIMPFMIFYFLVMLFMPAPEKPYEWNWLKSAGNRIRDSFLTVTQNIVRGGREDFDLSLGGFSEEGELGEGFFRNDREIMTIQGRSGYVTNVYLTGKIYDTFDGRQWQQEYHDYSKERLLDTAETMCAVRSFDRKYTVDYLREAKLKIIYRYFNTGYVFAPLKTWNIQKDNEKVYYTEDGGNLLSESPKGYGTEYEVTYFQMNAGQAVFDQLLRSKQEPDEAVFRGIMEDYERLNGEKLTSEILEEHRQKIYRNYLDDVALSEEVKEYLSGVTQDADTDLEKLWAIEKELSSYRYTRTPGQLPEEITDAGKFLDYFLLKSRQGYCTYFATAFTLLARAEGFPARYVQGFCVPVEGSGEVSVYSDMAHAWPEVYIDGIGWIPFEPTPGYFKIRYVSWKLSQENGTYVPEEVQRGRNRLTEETPEEIEDEFEETDPKAAERRKNFRKWTGYAVLAILAAYAGIAAADHMLHRHRYHRMNPEDKFKTEVHTNLQILSWLGFKREAEETLQELRKRGELEKVSLQFIERYEEVVYGGKKVEKEMIVQAGEERRQLLSLLKKRKRKTYIFYRIQLFFTGID